MATAIQRFTWNSLALDADDDSADDLLMTPLSPVFDANLYPEFETEPWANDVDPYLHTLLDDPSLLWQQTNCSSSSSDFTELANLDWSLNESDVTPCQYDVTSLPWQRDADDESLTTTLKRAMIPTVVESERVTDDDDVRDVSAPAVAGARQHDDVTVTRCHRPLSVVHQHLQRPRAITHGHVTPEVLSDVMSHDVIRRDVIRRGNSSSSCAVPPSPTKRRCRRARQQQHLWQFLLETLSNPKYNPCYIEWLDRSQGIFRFVESQKIARLWGLRRKRENMTYEYFSRAMRYYYARGIMTRVCGQRLVYQFGPNAHGWQVDYCNTAQS